MIDQFGRFYDNDGLGANIALAANIAPAANIALVANNMPHAAVARPALAKKVLCAVRQTADLFPDRVERYENSR